jgi:outer membrane protein OmpA-like peptidoglycan-associated protein
VINLLFIKFATIFLILTSCETVSNLTDSSSEKDDQLLSDELGSDPTLEEILADSEMNFEDINSEESNFESDDQLEVAEEILPANPTTEYDTNLIESDESPDSIQEEETISDLAQEKSNKEIIEPTTSQNVQSFDKTFERSKLDLNEQIQYRVATINFQSGSSSVNNAGLKKIKKIAKIAKERNAKIKIIGHASERTKDMPIAEHKLVNFIISDKRANSVAEIFIKKYNFPSDKLITQGVSDSKPLFKEIMPAGTTANQRTEIFLIY